MSEADRGAIDDLFSNLAKCIAAYERLLVRGDSPFDRFAAYLLGKPGGEPEALDLGAQRGLKIFLGRGGCILCHVGTNLTDSEFHNTAAPPGEFGDRQDPGRFGGAARVVVNKFSAAGPHSDQPDGSAARRVTRLRVSTESYGEFRTPSLRNLVSRAPYMHAGQFPDLEAVVHFYSTLEGASGRSHHQELVLQPLKLTPSEQQDLVSFLRSLEGAPLNAGLMRQPGSPLLK
jgi:cytochrome c peroxidase